MVETRTPRPDRKAPPEGPVSYEEFLEWADEDVFAEWKDGEIHVITPASATHQRLVRFLSNILSAYAEHQGSGEVFIAPFQMKLEVGPSGREPDVMVVKKENSDRVRDTYLKGPADLVVEVVSLESGPRDRGEKYYEYETSGVSEYWLVDSQRELLQLYRLTNDQYRTVFEGRDGRVDSSVIEGFWIEAEWLWSEERPTVLEVLESWGII